MREHYPDLFATADLEDDVQVKWGRVVTSQNLQVFSNPPFIIVLVIFSPWGWKGVAMRFPNG